VDGKSHFLGNLALLHGSIAFMTDQKNYPIEIADSILERNGVNALLEVPKEKSVRQWLVMRGVQERWVDMLLESELGELSLGVRDNYAFHIIQGQLKLTKVSMVQQEQILWAQKDSRIDLTEFIMRDHVFSVGISLDTYLSLENSEFSNIYCPLQH
jgi:hypothetical protein